jgi:Putative Ig domain
MSEVRLCARRISKVQPRREHRVLGKTVIAVAVLVAVFAPAVLGAPPAAAVDTSWTPTTAAAPSSLPNATSAGDVSSVSCPAEGWCIAVTSGSAATGTQGQIETLSNGVWQGSEFPNIGIGPSQATFGDATFSDVSCWAVGSCVAVGSDVLGWLGGGQDVGLIETLDGGKWSDLAAPLVGLSDPPATGSGPNPYPAYIALTKVSCAPGGTCAAIGTYRDASGNFSYLIETLIDGAWTATNAPLRGLGSPASSNPSVFPEGVSCWAANSCVVVGSYHSTTSKDGLIETLSGGFWLPSTAPVDTLSDSSPSHIVDLRSVSCAADGACVAVGGFGGASGGDDQDLITTRSGGTWTAMLAPLAGLSDPAGNDPGRLNDNTFALNSVSCPISGNCMAVGDYVDASGNVEGLMETLSGGTWIPTTAPLSGLSDEAATNPSVNLWSVSCVIGASCAIVGQYVDSSDLSSGLTITASGGAVVAASASVSGLTDPPASDPGSSLLSVSCASSTFCVSGGGYEDTASVWQGLLENLAPVVLDPIGPPGGTLRDAPLGLPYTYQLTDAGGTSPFSWAITSGSLPAGLTLDSKSGQITGTPVTTGISDFTIRLTDSSQPTPLDTEWSTSINVTLNFTVQTAPAQTGGPDVVVSVSGCPFASDSSFSYSWALNDNPLDQPSCSFSMPMPFGSDTFQLTVVDGAGTYETSQSFTVSPVAGFSYTVQPVPYGESTSSANVDLDACGGSGGITAYAWSVNGGPGQSSGTACEVLISMPAGTDTVVLTATGGDGGTLTVTAQIPVQPLLATPTESCSVISFGPDACWRYGLDTVGDIFGANNWRPPDFAVLSLGGTIGGVSAGVSSVLTCDGSLLIGPSLARTWSPTFFAGPEATEALAFGWIGDPSIADPSNSAIDDFVSKATASLEVDLGTSAEGGIVSSSPPYVGTEVTLGNLPIGITLSGSYDFPVVQGDGGSTCTNGVTADSFWQQLGNIQQASGTGLPQISQTSGSSTTVGAGVTVNVSTTGWAPGTNVTVTVHSNPVQLTRFPSDDAGSSSVNVTIPANIPGGDHTLVETGTAPNGQPRTVAIPFVVSFGIATTQLPNAARGKPYVTTALNAAGIEKSGTGFTTKLKWKKVSLPKGLKLSSGGVLSGTPSTKLVAGPSSVKVQVTATVTTLNGKMKIKTKTTAQATIPLTIT